MIKSKIQKLLASDRIVLFIKGEKNCPVCGFSANVINILKKLKFDFISINVLKNEQIRRGIKEFSNWPTIPQLYVDRKFIGGNDIVVEMYRNGDLLSLLKNKIK